VLENALRRTATRRVTVAGVYLVVGLLAAARAGAEPTALQVEAPGTPQYVHGSDGREHLEYDLIITNVFTAEATLTSLEVRGDGRRLLVLRGAALAAVTLPPFGSAPTARIAPASTVVTLVDIAMPAAAGRAVPPHVTNRIQYAIPPDAPARSLIGSTTVTAPLLRTDRRAPVVIAPPLRGSGWVNLNGCCSNPTSPHRNIVLSQNGTYVTPEIFAIDWIRLVDGRLYTGDGTKNSDWPAYGAPLYAVADGTVVSTVNNLPDIPPRAAPNLSGPQDYGGNSVSIKIGPDRYAVYAHLQAGSVRVRRGQRVRTGQVIGRLGNSGNTTAPHLHFGIQERPDPLSKSEPFEINHYTVEGTVDLATSVPPQITVTGPPHRERRSLPLIGSVISLSGR
jgi:murein DD-endopeptidase MepM/ murein hydrolase activator NlpD